MTDEIAPKRKRGRPPKSGSVPTIRTVKPPTPKFKPYLAEKVRKDFAPGDLPTKQIEASFPPKFEPFLTRKARWKVCFGGRGAGKTMSIAKALLLIGQQRPIRVLCCREIMQSVKESVYFELKNSISDLGLEAFYTVQGHVIFGQPVTVTEAGIDKIKRTEFFFAGLKSNVEQIKSYSNVNYCWCEEANNISAESWQILGPTIRQPGSEIWISFNPRNEKDATYERFVLDQPEDSIVINMNYWDNPWFGEPMLSDMLELKRKNYAEYLHVWEGQCVQYYAGAVYADEMKAASDEGRITNVPHTPGIACEAYFDLGSADATAMWIVQRVGSYIHLIDYHEAVRSTFDYFAKWIENKPYVVVKYWLPHDARQRTSAAPMSYEALVRAKGKKVGIVPGGPGSVAMGINALRTLFPIIRIDKEKCAIGIECLRRYRFELVPDKEIGGYKSEPVHDRWSHGADAARYMAFMMRQPKEKHDNSRKYAPMRQSMSQNSWMSL